MTPERKKLVLYAQQQRIDAERRLRRSFGKDRDQALATLRFLWCIPEIWGDTVPQYLICPHCRRIHAERSCGMALITG